MKSSTRVLSALFALAGFTQPAHATLENVATLLAKGRGASYGITTKSIHDPIVVEAEGKTRKGQTVKSTASTSPDAFGAAVRAKVPSRRVHSGEYTYQLEWEKISSVGSDGSLPLYDIVTEIKENLYDPSDSGSAQPEIDGSYNQTTKLLSITGPIVSMRADGGNYYPGAAHPNYWEVFRTYDVRRLDKSTVSFESASLVNVVEEASLVQALKKDRALSKLVPSDSRAKFKASKNLREMEEAISMNLESCYSFPSYEGKISAFAIHSYEPKTNEVSVRIALGAAAHVCQAIAPLLQLGVKVQATPEFRKILTAQVQKKDGVFMSSVAK